MFQSLLRVEEITDLHLISAIVMSTISTKSKLPKPDVAIRNRIAKNEPYSEQPRAKLETGYSSHARTRIR